MSNNHIAAILIFVTSIIGLVIALWKGGGGGDEF